MSMCLTACGGGGSRGPSDQTPTIVAAAFVGGTSTPAAGDTLLLTFSEDVTLAAGALLTDADFALSDNTTLGNSTIAPQAVTARTAVLTLGVGVNVVPGTTTIALAPGNDAVLDSQGQLGQDGAPITIAASDGIAPILTSLRLAAVDDILNGRGSAGGTLQVPANGWTIDLSYSDNGLIDTARTWISASVAVNSTTGQRPAGTNLQPFLTTRSATNTTASYQVPATMTFPAGAVTFRAFVIDSSGLAASELTYSATVRAFTNALRPFETSSNAQQVWFLDFTRDIESFTASSVTGGAAVTTVDGANGTSDFEDLLRIIGLNAATPIANVSGNQDSNQVVQEQFKTQLLAELASLHDGANVTFTLTRPNGSFGTSTSVPYDSLGYSQISIAGAPTSAGILGIAIFDPNNSTQNDDTVTSFSGMRLGVFLHTIVSSGMGPPGSSAFRLTFNPLAPALGGTAIGENPQDDQRLLGTLQDARATIINTAIADFARFTAVVTAHECGHSVGLVQDGAMPIGLYGGDTTNFPGSSGGHIRTATLFPSGATNVMSPTLSYSSATNPASTFNSLNLAYLREQVFYGN